MYIPSRTCSPIFRDKIKQLVPQLGNNPAYWNLFGVMAFGVRSKETGNVRVPRHVLAQCEGEDAEKELEYNRYIARRFLWEFSSKVFRIDAKDFELYNGDIGEWSFSEHKSRELERIDWPQGVPELIEKERKREWRASGRVFLSDGTKATPQKERELLKTSLQQSLHKMEETNVPIAKILLDYMNRRSIRTFKALRKNLPAAEEAALKEKDVENALNLLLAFRDDAKPIYKTVMRSARIYPLTENICQLPRNVRKALTKGWLEADLRSAQLATSAHLWKLTEVENFLSKKNSIWTSLFETFGIEPNQEAKDILKEALYTTMYGGSQVTIAEILSPLGTNAFEIFISNRIVNMVWEERKHQLAVIKENGGGRDCFDRWIKVDATKGVNCRSVLAQLSQSMEMNLLTYTINLAVEQEHKSTFLITLFQHDGFSISVKRFTQKKLWMNELSKAVDKRAKELGIATSLEWSIPMI